MASVSSSIQSSREKSFRSLESQETKLAGSFGELWSLDWRDFSDFCCRRSMPHIFRVKHDLDVAEAFRNFDVAAELARIAETALLNLNSDVLRVLEMIKELPDQATQHRLLEEFEISRSNVMPTIKELKKMKSELRKIERDADVAGQSLPSDGSPELRIDMPEENNVPAEKHKSSEEAGKSVADRINEGGLAYLTNSSTSFPGPPWLRNAMVAARLLAFVSTAAGYGTRAYNEKLSRFLSKVGALAVSAVVIAWLAMPLPPVVAWIVGLAAWLITAATVLFN